MDKEIVKGAVFKLGADVCGIADIGRFKDAPDGFHPADILPEARSVIIFGRQFLKGVFKVKSNVPYTLVRNNLIQKMDEIAMNLSLGIEAEGFLAVPVPSSAPYDYWDEERKHGRGIMSLKHAAQLAGLGNIGKNTLLINKKFGNRLWLGAVITDMELDPDPLTKSLCPESCRICIEACPQGALNGITIDQKRCREISFTVTEGGEMILSCNICRKECPFSAV
jgi:epoxyqueuosine reductase